jgi:hypothetical protein
MRFAKETVCSRRIVIENVTIIESPLRITRVKDTIFFHRIVRKSLTTPNKPEGVSLVDGEC